jgi:hypothetical protein
MATFVIASSSTTEVVKALRSYLEDVVPSDFASLAIDAEKSHNWHVNGIIFVDYKPLGVEICAKTSAEETSVSVNHTSHNDIVSFNSIVRQIIGFLQSRGLQVSGNLPVSNFQARCLDDDDDFADSDDEEESSWDEKVLPVLKDTNSTRTEVREEAFRAIVQWVSSNPSTHEAIAKGFIDRATELSSLFHASSRASVAETYPFAVAMRKLSEGFCTMETCDKILNSALSTMMEASSKPRVSALIAREYNMAMKALGKVEISKPVDEFVYSPEPNDKSKVQHSFLPEPSKHIVRDLQVSRDLLGQQNLVIGC